MESGPGAGGLSQLIIVKIIDHVRGSWRYRWWALGVAWVVSLIGWIFVMQMPNVYQASARVYLDSQSALRPLLKGLAVDPDVESELGLVRQAMLSRPHLEKVAAQAGLDTRAKTPEQRERLINSLRTRINIETDAHAHGSDGLYRISFMDVSAANGLLVVRSLLDSFVEDTLGSKRTGQEDAQRFLTTQLADYEKRLSDAEEALSDFKKKNVGKMPDDKGDYFTKYQTELSGLEEVRNSMQLAAARREELTKQLSGEEPFMFGFDAQQAAQNATQTGKDGGDVTMRIQQLEHREEELLLKYTEKHPEVLAVQATIAELKERQQKELDRINRGQKPSGALSQSVKSNPVYQSIEVEKKRADLQIAELRQDLAQRQARVAELQKLVNTVPEVEAELARLNRDYEVTRGQYQALAQRLETAKLSEQADRTGAIKFQIIDPPAAATEPVAPNRLILLPGVLIAGLAAGIALAYLLNLLHPVFHNARALADMTGLPVLGAVGRTWVDRQNVRERAHTLAFSALLALLVGVFLAALVLRNVGSAWLNA